MGRSLRTSLALLALLAAAAAPAAQFPYRTGQSSYAFTDSAGITMPAIIYHPSARQSGQPLDPSMRFPAVVFLQGANVDAARYSWLQSLAAHGYIVVLPDKYPVPGPRFNGEDGINPNTKLTSVDVLVGAIAGLRRHALQPASPIGGRFDGRIVLAGHSLGGYAAIIGLDESRCPVEPLALCPPLYQRDPALVAMWLLGGHREGNGDVDPTGTLSKPPGFPIYLIAGERDNIASVAEVSATYARYEFPKRYWVQPGANHFGWTAYLSPEDNLRDEIPATLAPADQQAQVVDAVRRFLACELHGDSKACGSVPTTN